MGTKVLFRKNDSDIIKENFTLVSDTCHNGGLLLAIVY